MSDFRSRLIQSYRLLTMPSRHFRFVQMSKNGSVPVFVLFYHRVSNSFPNPWTIDCGLFEQQIDWFQQNFEIVDLQECQRRIRGGFNSRPTLAISFDDGYAENAEFALPMLIERRIPVTYFVTHHTIHQQPFQHDVERGAPLPTNSIESLRALDMAGVEIGGHTRNHVDLGAITCDQTLVDEVIVASQEMEAQVGRKIRYFAFPFGQFPNLNANVFAMLKEAGFLGVCSAYGGWNEIGGDSFHLQRVHGDPNMARIKNWLTFDPRIAKIERFDYSQGTFDPSLLPQVVSAPETVVETKPAPPVGLPVHLSDPSVESFSTHSNTP